METVARAKLSGGGPWQPGLLSVVVDGKVRVFVDYLLHVLLRYTRVPCIYKKYAGLMERCPPFYTSLRPQTRWCGGACCCVPHAAVLYACCCATVTVCRHINRTPPCTNVYVSVCPRSLTFAVTHTHTNTQTTDALGLGDAVFPAMLAGWAVRRDAAASSAAAASSSSAPSPASEASAATSSAVSSGEEGAWEQLTDQESGNAYFWNPVTGETAWEPPAAAGGRAAVTGAGLASGEGGGGYFGAAMAGYCLGCFLCEVTNSGGGQPALLLLVSVWVGGQWGQQGERRMVVGVSGDRQGLLLAA